MNALFHLIRIVVLIAGISTCVIAQKLVFTKEMFPKLDDRFQFVNGFMPGDPMYGFIYLDNNALNYYKLEDFRNDEKNTLPIEIQYFSKKEGVYNQIYLEVPYNDGQLEGQLKTHGHYFLILPSSSEKLNDQQVKLMKVICAAGPEGITFTVKAGKGLAYEVNKTISDKFFIVTEKGCGPYSDWLKPFLEKEAKDQMDADAKNREKQNQDKLNLTKWVHDFASRRNDPNLEKKIIEWWNNNNPGFPAMRVFFLGPDFSMIRDEYNQVLRKIVPAMIVYKGKNNTCWAQWSKFGYEHLGGGAFAEELTSWKAGYKEYSNYQFDAAGITLEAVQNYELNCALLSK